MEGDTKRNTRCLICLEVVPEGTSTDEVQVCSTCPRIMHVSCLELPEDEKRIHDFCLVCQNRGWHITAPADCSDVRELEGDELLMARAHRYGLWREAVESGDIKILTDRVEDDGSIEADRHVLLEIGAVTDVNMRACKRAAEGNDDDDGASDIGSLQGTELTGPGVAMSESPAASSSTAIDDLINGLIPPKRAGRKRKLLEEYSQNDKAKQERQRRMRETEVEREIRLANTADKDAVYKRWRSLRKSQAFEEMDAEQRETALAKCREEAMKSR